MHVSLILLLSYIFTLTSADYWKNRDELLKVDESRMLGASIVLSEKERSVNKILMGYKLDEYDAGFKIPRTFAPGRHFFRSRKDVEKSKVFQFIKEVPKGALLHAHDIAMVSEDFLYDLTFKDNLYACTIDERLRLRFLLHPNQDTSCNWTLVSIQRQLDPDYDKWLRSQLTLTRDNPEEVYGDINQVWKVFHGLFGSVIQLLMFRPVFEEFTYQYLKELHDDNVMYAEVRGTLEPVYELDGTTYNPVEIVCLYDSVFRKFKTDFPDFYGARLIYAPYRRVANETLANYAEILREISARYPDVVAGFDLVGQEDAGHPLSEFVTHLLPLSARYNFFFHAGETNWQGSTSDFNLVDAILLGTRRIGHGYGLSKHPELLDIVKEREIGIEVCPISNQVLMLVEDMRNHPAAALIADGYPVVISSDDPSFWSTKGLSYDFYMAFMGMAARNADLRLLKQLALNSLKYSVIPEDEKCTAFAKWETQWDSFINSLITEF